jgi:ribonuclease III
MSADQGELEQKLNHTFKDRQLLDRALTHKSRAFESGARGGETSENNEQLEFLGDAVLGFVVSEVLVENFPHLPEGRLSKSKARLVSADKLHEVAQELSLGQYLLLGRGEEMNGGRTKRALLANSVEALIAAIYLDGGYQSARDFITRCIVGDIEEFAAEEEQINDFKGALQEFAQGKKLPAPRYRVLKTTGPEHSKTFLVEVSIGDGLSALASGPSKKVAGQHAASDLLKRVSDDLAVSERPSSDC